MTKMMKKNRSELLSLSTSSSATVLFAVDANANANNNNDGMVVESSSMTTLTMTSKRKPSSMILVSVLLLQLLLLLLDPAAASASASASAPGTEEAALKKLSDSNDGGLLRLAGYETSSRNPTTSHSHSSSKFWSQSIQSQSLASQLELEHAQIELIASLESYNFEKASRVFIEKFKLSSSSSSSNLGDSRSRSSSSSSSRIDDLFFDYYGRSDYSDEWILAALDGRSTPPTAPLPQTESETETGGGDDFGLLSADGRAAAIQTATITMQSLTMMSRWMKNANDQDQDQDQLDDEDEDPTTQTPTPDPKGAIDVCVRECSPHMMNKGKMEYKVSGMHDDTICTQAAEHWDHAVAVFVGPSGSGSSSGVPGGNGGGGGGRGIDDDQYDYHGHGHHHGHMLYSLMGRYAHEFHYDDDHDDHDHHATSVRHNIMKLFTEGQDSLWESDCRRAGVLMNNILNLLNVVLVQGVLKNSWFLDENNIIKDDDDDLDTFWGEGAAFTASLLPILNECSTNDANKLQTMMKIRRTESSNHHARQVDYDEIRNILERNYKCFGISKDMVGTYDGPDISSIDEEDRSNYTDDFTEEYEDEVNDRDESFSASSSSLLRSSRKSTAADSVGGRGSYGEESTSGFLSIAGVGLVVVVFGFLAKRKNQLRTTTVRIHDTADTLLSRRERRRQRYLNHRDGGEGGGDGGMIGMVEITPSRFSSSLSSLNATSVPFLDDDEDEDEDDDSDSDFSEESEDLRYEELRQVSRAANRIARMGDSGRSLETGGMRRRSTHAGLDDSIQSAFSLSGSSFHG